LIFSAYTRVEESEDDIKNDLTTSNYSRFILLGDINARIGQDRQSIRKAVRGQLTFVYD